MARLHRASLEHLHLGHRFGFQPFDDEWRSTWNDVIPTLRRGLAGEDGFGEMMGMLDRDVAMLEVWLDDLQTSRRPLAEATIHGDLNLRNLIFRDNRLVAVIDWDDCRVGPIAWEVAQTAFEVAAAERLTFWSAYLNAGGPLLPGDVNLLPNLARMGALLQLQYTVKDGHATPHAMDQLTNVTRALARISGINS
jgi:Ser/Thr protein kinase RdoA (MazF antagonist)